MTTSDHARPEPSVQSARPGTLLLVRHGALAGAAAAVCTAAVAAIARAADVSLEVDGAAIPIPAFPLWTFVGAALGVALVRLLRERRQFLVVAIVGTCLSLVPPLALPDDAATKAVLVAAHLLAGAIIVATLSHGLTAFAATGEARDR